MRRSVPLFGTASGRHLGSRDGSQVSLRIGSGIGRYRMPSRRAARGHDTAAVKPKAIISGRHAVASARHGVCLDRSEESASG